MPEMISADYLRAFFIFVVPGLIALFTRSQFIYRRAIPLNDAVISYITLSIIYHACIFPFVPQFYVDGKYSGFYALGWLLILIVMPAVFGCLLGFAAQKSWLEKLFMKIGVRTIHPVPTAWDWRFSTIKESWALIVLKDETTWAGVLGEKSFISSDPTERDIYLEEVYTLDDQNVWHARGSSVLITHGEIQSIEFWPKRSQI